MEDNDWPSEWTRAALPGAVLAIVDREAAYGYLIAQRLASAGLGVIKGSTLYPLLARLEQDGDLSSRWEEGAGGPGRKYYTITAAGARRREELRDAWANFAAMTTLLLSEKETTA